MRILKQTVHSLGSAYCRKICKSEYEAQRFVRINERPIEFRFVFQHLTSVQPRSVLDVGTGTTALPHLVANCGFVVTAIDNVRDYWSYGMFNRHFHVLDDDITSPRIRGGFDFITCISVLEHIKEHDRAVDSMSSLLNPGGYIALTFPYNEAQYLENVYDLPEASYGRDLPYVCQVYSRAKLDSWIQRNGLEIVQQEFWQCFTGRFWTFGKQLSPPRQVDKSEDHQLSCLLVRRPKE